MYNFIQKPDAYNPEMWKSHISHNCYMYALNYTGDNPTIWPGEISGFDFSEFLKTGYCPIDELRQRLFYDCKKIGLEIREVPLYEEPTDDEWKIALLEKWIPEYGDYDFHFLRQDAPNNWSGKFIGELPSNLDDNYTIITSPEKAEFWLYKFIACFILKKVS